MEDQDGINDDNDGYNNDDENENDDSIGKTCTRGVNGEMKWKTEREVYYVCDVGGDNKKKLKQTTLSFGLIREGREG